VWARDGDMVLVSGGCGPMVWVDTMMVTREQLRAARITLDTDSL
jgi:hypothetical protein